MATFLPPMGIFSLLVLLLSFSLPAQSATRPEDQAAMDAFYNSLQNKGELPATAPSDWCDGDSGVTCSNEQVIEINWASINIHGTISSSLGNLTALQILSLSENGFIGTIPSELGNLGSLREISLDQNELAGTIPSELGNMESARSLNFNHNQLTGTIPYEFGNLGSLIDLNLEFNQLTGTIPSALGQLSSLETCFLNNNQLTGAIPSELGNLESLEELHIDSNQLTGTIPSNLGNSGSLLEIFLLGTNNFCPMVNYSSWAPNNDFPGSTNCTSCVSFTCQNNGTCSGGFNELFNCSCSSALTGRNCEIIPDCLMETAENATFPFTPVGSSANGTCDQGYYGSPSRLCQDGGSWGAVLSPCTACNCSTGSQGSNCTSEGVCTCLANFQGDKCSLCVPTFFGTSCKACGCSASGSLNQICNAEGHCDCKTGFAGDKCSQCTEGRSGPNCTPDNDSPGSQMFLPWRLMILCLGLSIPFL